MKLRDIREIVVWASAALIVVAGVFWASAAFTQEERGAQPNILDGCVITAIAAPADKPYSIELTITAENTAPTAKNLDFDIEVVRNEFVGSPFTRVLSPLDFKAVVERSEHVKLVVSAKGSAKKVMVIPIDARPAEGKEGKASGVSYYVQVPGGKAAMVLTGFSADIAWAKKTID